MVEPWLTTAIAAATLLVLTWIVSLPTKDASIVDVAWGLGFVVIGWVTFALFPDDPLSMIPLAMVTIWGLRLAVYIGLRKRGKGEDYRYKSMRDKAPNTFPRDSLFKVFLFQAVLLWLVSLPLQMGIAAPPPEVNVLVVAGIALWLTGVFFESVGDWQLARFKADPENQGRVMDQGLWRYTRHPNYFGDFCVWWGIYLFALAGGHWWTAVGPLIMTALLMRISGAALLEKTIGQRRPGYEEYVARTNAFFPGPPRG
jgi:steroid 5-alpha reductase family enzyme